MGKGEKNVGKYLDTKLNLYNEIHTQRSEPIFFTQQPSKLNSQTYHLKK